MSVCLMRLIKKEGGMRKGKSSNHMRPDIKGLSVVESISENC